MFPVKNRARNIIYVSPKFIKRIVENKSLSDPQGFIAYVLAHEIGLFIFEYSMFKNDYLRSLNGNISLLQIDLDDKSREMEARINTSLFQGAINVPVCRGGFDQYDVNKVHCDPKVHTIFKFGKI